MHGDALRLNPCFSGCWSRTNLDGECGTPLEEVLILVLVDVGLGPARVGAPTQPNTAGVLILVLVDVGLGLELVA